MIRLEPITKDNYKDAIAITVTSEQKLIIADVVYSLAQCYVYPDILQPFLVVDGEKPVGFILFIVITKKDQYEFNRIMIDQHHQGKGYGRQAMLLGIEYLKNKGAKVIELSHLSNNPHPSKLYQSLGFTYTGVVEDGEVMMELIINK